MELAYRLDIRKIFAVIEAFKPFLYLEISNFEAFILPFTAGGFIYIAGSDLIPELHKQNLSASRSIVQFLALVLGILIMLSMVLLE